MMDVGGRLLALAVAGLAMGMGMGAPAGAEEMAPQPRVDCSVARYALASDLAAWGQQSPAVAAKTKRGLKAAVLAVGKAVRADLAPTGDVKYVLRPEKPGGPGSYGGLFALDIVEAGDYRVALGAGAWIDMVRDGKAVESVGHAHGPDCSGIRKMVDFALTPGRYILQIAASGEPGIGVLVVPKR